MPDNSPMDFPMFFLDFFGNRILIAVVASLHVFINHPFAVGAYPLVFVMEWWGRKSGNPLWDNLAYKITFVLFIVTTSVGALTGVGIWLTTALIAPFGIGSLLRVFFWGWFIEWIVFISEVVLVVVYFLTWKKWSEGNLKKLHLTVGGILAGMSWLTMAIITGILGFMMGSGNWTTDQSFFSAFFNPLYMPQLAFRTFFAMLLAGLLCWFLTFFFTKKDSDFRPQAVRFIAIWVFVMIPLTMVSAIWYYNIVPEAMLTNVNVAIMTQAFMQWHTNLAMIMAITLGVTILLTLIGLSRPRMVGGVMLLVPFVLSVWWVGHFERVREFIRKPYVIADYMYSNGIKVADLPIYKRDGVLRYSTFVKHHSVTPDNKIAAGRDVFMVTCSRCHTTNGLNSVVTKFHDLYGDGEWDDNAMFSMIATMHMSRTFMPPFPGNDDEADALVAYIKDLRQRPAYIFNAQSDWTVKPPAAAQN